MQELKEMDKKRFIKDTFWEDEQLLEIDKNTKYLLLYLITNPSVNLSGLYKISERKIEFHTGLSLKEIKESLEILNKIKKVFYFDGWIFIRKSIQHNNLKNSNIVEGIRNSLVDVPADILEKAKKLGLSESLELIGYSVLDSDRTVSNSVTTVSEYSNSNSNSNSKIEYTEILDLWNSKKIIIHKQLGEKTKRIINSLLKEFSFDDIKKAINTYASVLKDDNTFWTYKWTLEEFLQRDKGMRVFVYKTIDDYRKKDNSMPKRKEDGWI